MRRAALEVQERGVEAGEAVAELMHGSFQTVKSVTGVTHRTCVRPTWTTNRSPMPSRANQGRSAATVS